MEEVPAGRGDAEKAGEQKGGACLRVLEKWDAGPNKTNLNKQSGLGCLLLAGRRRRHGSYPNKNPVAPAPSSLQSLARIPPSRR